MPTGGTGGFQNVGGGEGAYWGDWEFPKCRRR